MPDASDFSPEPPTSGTRHNAVTDPSDQDAWFGDVRVPAAEKTYRVRAVFNDVARRYDLMNDLMSGGVHRLWKADLVALVAPKPGQRLLDVAGGTGDIAFRLQQRAKGEAEVVVCDINEQMLRVGRDRQLDQGVAGSIAWVVGDAETLPLPDRSIDAYTIAFGLRNVTRIGVALEEARRVLRPGGRFFCLEFSHVTMPALAPAYRLYSDAVLPSLGRLVAGNRDAYAYLVESIRRFPTQEGLAAMIERAGLGRVRVRNLTGGIAAIHSAWRL